MKKALKILLWLIVGIIVIIVILIIAIACYIGFEASQWTKQNSGAETMDNTVITKSYFLPKPMTKAECDEYSNGTNTRLYCDYDEDYFSGAISQCGGIEYLPTPEQLEDISKHVYHYGTTEYDGKEAKKYGLPESLNSFPDKTITIWSKHIEWIETGAVFAERFQTNRSYGSSGHSHPYYAICIKNK